MSDPINPNFTNYDDLTGDELSFVESIAQEDQNLDLPVALRKGTRDTKPPYPLANYLSFENFSPTHRTFLRSLNTTTIPSSVSKELIDKK